LSHALGSNFSAAKEARSTTTRDMECAEEAGGREDRDQRAIYLSARSALRSALDLFLSICSSICFFWFFFCFCFCFCFWRWQQ
jgi:hypothetical protein